MYHPAAALHQPALKQTLIHDFSQLSALVEKAKQSAAGHSASQEPKAEDDATQLSFF